MRLQTNKNLRVLDNKEKIPAKAICYGKLQNGKVGWCNPGKLVNTEWNKYSINSPSIIMTTKTL